VISKRLKSFSKELSIDVKDYEILEREFVVIYKFGAHLLALAVEWKNGVAYRIGILYVDEGDWIRLQNRVWKRVILG